ncbi:hypothetical protein [Stenomitos frigidus]|uniref:Uncharacterized protein n=1 Tax=Stenomitos frigidus ULC18 TaxID=2107698 RepID=A0A2T1DZY6_9CYAN|nr:hypothetical protein [Stenomitos frigidus]PSB26065.1 hypothetical protein C7B82_20840 [Stenomitos frigidus ULC18]
MVFSTSDPSQPQSAVTVLRSIYGAPSQAGFGSAVFDDAIEPGTDLEPIALRYYQHFVGKLWEQYGESAWMSAWQQVYVRPDGLQPDIVAELRAIGDRAAAQFVPILLLVETDDATKAQQALAEVYDDPQTTDLRVYTVGDGAAMSGLLLLGRQTTGETIILISLLD